MKLCWKVGNGKNIKVGIDPIIGIEEDYKLSSNILNYLDDIGYTTLAQIRRPIWRNRDCSYSLTTKDLGLIIQESTIELEAYVKNLNLAGRRLSMEEDSLIWSENLQTSNIFNKYAYKVIVQDSSITAHKWWYKLICKLKIPLKFKCFLWLTLQNYLKTWDNLLKRG